MFRARIVIFLLLFMNTGCLPSFDECDVDKLEAALHSKRGDYNKEVLKNLAKYEKLKDFILLHLDTILSHNQKRCISSITTVNGKRDTLFCDPLSYFTLHNYGDGNRIKDQIPGHLYAGFMLLYNSINPNQLNNVSFTTEGRVYLFVSDEKYDEDGVKILHLLEWNSKIDRSDIAPLKKDTLLANGGRYLIYTDCYRGH